MSSRNKLAKTKIFALTASLLLVTSYAASAKPATHGDAGQANASVQSQPYNNGSASLFDRAKGNLG